MYLRDPDRPHYMYGVRKDKKYWVIIDGKREEGPYDRLGWGSAGYINAATGKFTPAGRGYPTLIGLFDPTSTHYAYAAKISDKWVMIIDGKSRSGNYKDIHMNFSFVPQSRKLSFWGQHQNTWMLYFNGKDVIDRSIMEAKWYSFSPNGSRVLLSGSISNKTFIAFVELTKGETSEWDVNDVRRPGARKSSWSEDGSRWVLAIKQKDSWYILDNGKKIAVTGDFVDYPVLSPDGKILMYSTKLHKDNGVRSSFLTEL